jgi:hypothetical protein
LPFPNVETLFLATKGIPSVNFKFTFIFLDTLDGLGFNVDMELKYKASKTEPLTQRFTLPISVNLEELLDQAKADGIDVNKMTREFLLKLSEKAAEQRSKKKSA